MQIKFFFASYFTTNLLVTVPTDVVTLTIYAAALIPETGIDKLLCVPFSIVKFLTGCPSILKITTLLTMPDNVLFRICRFLSLLLYMT